jgi:amidase
VATREVDMAIGCDQGGSIRIPSAWCGIFGLKPTYGLVPYTGIFPIEMTLDHAGPMARTVADLALLLEVIAGKDELDPRQREVRTEPYTGALNGSIKGLRLALVKEGFGWEGVSEQDVDQMVTDVAHRLERRGATVATLSLPFHREGIHIHNAIINEGATILMMKGNGTGTNWKGHYMTSLLSAFADGRRSRANDLSETVKFLVLLGQYMQDNYHGRYYAKAQNLGRTLRAAYDDALRQFDLLVMPTTPMKPTLLPPANAGSKEIIARAHEMNLNTCPFDVTGHPALSVPCGLLGGLPVGMMLIGRHWEDGTVLRAGYAFEQLLK